MFEHECADQGTSLSHAAGDFPGRIPFEAEETEPFEKKQRLLPVMSIFPGYPHRQEGVLEQRKPRQEQIFLLHVCHVPSQMRVSRPAPRDRSFVLENDAAENIKKCALSAARRTDESGKSAPRNGQSEIVKDSEIIETLF